MRREGEKETGTDCSEEDTNITDDGKTDRPTDRRAATVSLAGAGDECNAMSYAAHTTK